jgi:hypothetical protein
MRKKILLLCVMLGVLAAPLLAAVEKTDGGIKFTYYDPDATQVFLAGAFNGWSTTATPMTKDQAGIWSTVVDLKAGAHEYKFVVDGTWTSDPDNLNTKPDPYGGVNSVVEVDAKGDIVVAAGTAQRLSNTPLNERVLILGRYLSRTNVEKNVEGDPRWRVQRPVQNVDFNFTVTISDIAQGYSRLRIDSSKDFLRPNDLSAYLDEAQIRIAPQQFSIIGYYNEEILQSDDPLHYFGDVDLPGTIFDDHLKAGKGTAGAVVRSAWNGFDLQGFAANVNDYDIYNNPTLFDNTGTDLYHGRLSRNFWLLTPGIDFFMQRNVWWLDFTNVVGVTPAATGIPRLDAWLDRSGDPSDWFEFDDKSYYAGFDIGMPLYGDSLLPQFEYLRGRHTQEFIESNRSGINLDNGPIDVPILERDQQIIHARVRCDLVRDVPLFAAHTRYETMNPHAGESMLNPAFQPDATANKHIFFTVDSDPATTKHDYSEFWAQLITGDVSARLWFQRNLLTASYPEERITRWAYNWSATAGLDWQALKRLDIALEDCYTRFEGSSKLSATGSSIETITKGSYELTKTLSAFLDVRIIRYTFEHPDGSDEARTFTAPWTGLEYQPMRKVSVVLAYGLDPYDFNDDYSGRETGRYNYRQQYFWSNPDASILDAEQYLADAKIVCLRAIFNF